MVCFYIYTTNIILSYIINIILIINLLYITDEMILILKKTGNIENSIENFLATGNISSKTGLGLMQDKGTVFCSRISYNHNFKFLAIIKKSYNKAMTCPPP